MLALYLGYMSTVLMIVGLLALFTLPRTIGKLVERAVYVFIKT